MSTALRRQATMLAVGLALAAIPRSGVHAALPALQGPQAVSDSAYGCLICHADKRRAFRMGVHSERGIRCHDCHGGDPRVFETATAHRGRFVGTPTKRGTVTMCSTCHADPNQMRQYGLAADQLAEFRTSRHGELLLGRGNDDAPTCTDCHDAHLILPPEDARSNVHPTNIPATCGACHQAAELMAEYDLPTDQLRRYRAGAHGIAVFEEQNYAAPTCIGCHGSHAALPPQVTEIAHVCGDCHVLLARSLYEGAHGPPALSGAFPGCLGCHSNHGTERVRDENVAESCLACHEAGSQMAALGQELEDRILHARSELDAAAAAINEMVGSGRDVADERFRLRAARSAFRQIAHVQHSLAVGELDDLGRQVRTETERIRATAEQWAEHRWERKLWLAPIWFLTLAGVALAWFKWRELGG